MAQENMSLDSTECLAAASADSPGFSVSASSSTRPTSSHTLHSTFADSAVDMEATTPTDLADSILKKGACYFEPTLPPTPLDTDHSLSDRMRQLAAIAWTLEQDDNMAANKRNRLHSMLQKLEGHLESASEANSAGSSAGSSIENEKQVQEAENGDAAAPKGASQQIVEEEKDNGNDDEWIDESELIAVRENLATTLRAMRMRQKEQTHLHELIVQKLEAVAQRSIAQEQQTRKLLREVRELRLENHTLGSENDQLRDKVASLEIDASRNEVAVEAMSSAVTGLEGWIESTTPLIYEPPVREAQARRKRVVIRGKGRFRGRYYVDEDGD